VHSRLSKTSNLNSSLFVCNQLIINVYTFFFKYLSNMHFPFYHKERYSRSIQIVLLLFSLSPFLLLFTRCMIKCLNWFNIIISLPYTLNNLCKDGVYSTGGRQFWKSYQNWFIDIWNVFDRFTQTFFNCDNTEKSFAHLTIVSNILSFIWQLNR